MRGWVTIAARAAAGLCLAAGMALSARPAWRVVRAAGAAANARRVWVQCRAEARRGASRAADGAASPAPPAAWLRASGLGLSVLVRRGDGPADLLRSPCLVAEATGLTVIAAHRDKHFRPLRGVGGGERVELESPDGRRRTFRVVETEVLPPDRVGARLAEQAGGPWLVLMTCHPFRCIGPAPNRFLAWAKEESRTTPGS